MQNTTTVANAEVVGLDHQKLNNENNQAAVMQKILIVDDEDYVRSLLRNMLKKMGFAAIEAADGDVGLAAFTEEQGSIVACVIDLTMPGMAGMELLGHIRKISNTVPILLVSGYSRHEVRQQESKSTNVSFLQKPFTLDQFQSAISVQLSRANRPKNDS